jgi:ATP-dependent DNA helicase RecQ
LSFGAGHLIDVLLGKATDKTRQHGHESLSTFSLGADLSEAQWRSVLRQLIALGHVQSVGEYNTLELTDSARAVLRGEAHLVLRQRANPRHGHAPALAASRAHPVTGVSTELDPRVTHGSCAAHLARRRREHNLPAFVVFHDTTLLQLARQAPATLDDLAGISGVGVKKLQAYGQDILRVLRAA